MILQVVLTVEGVSYVILWNRSYMSMHVLKWIENRTVQGGI